MKNPSILKISALKGDWAECDVTILYACFTLLEDCVENERLLEIIDWTICSWRIEVEAEITELYTWWKERKVLDPYRPYDDGKDHYEKDSDMLIRLIKIRQHLWT